MAYTGIVTDPFKRKAPDGRTYFDVLGAPRGAQRIYKALERTIVLCEREAQAATDPAVRSYWNGWMLRFDKALVEFATKLERIAVDTAAVADTRIVHHIDHHTGLSGPFRPRTSKATHMRDSIESRAIPTTPPLGGVGIALVSKLNKGTRRGRWGSYWEAQEFGTDAHLGRLVVGFFQPGRSKPSAAEFRNHPEFRSQRGKGTPAMKIGKEIEERAFLRRGVEDAWRYRRRKLQSLEREMIRVAQAFQGTQAPPSRTPSRRRR